MGSSSTFFFFLILSFLSCGALAQSQVASLPLADESAPMTLDYFAWDPATHRLWVPGGNTGTVVVLDRVRNTRTTVSGFPTKELERNGRHFRLGPSSATIGNGVVYVGDRADGTVCVLDAVTLTRGACAPVAASKTGGPVPDGILYVDATHEIWITTRGASAEEAVVILDASDSRDPKRKAAIALGGAAEGFAVDDARGLFFTNVEESGETVAIDVRSRKVVSHWKPGCDSARGLAIDRKRGFLFVACMSRVVAVDTKRGEVLGALATAEGLDNIDYSETDGLLYAAGARTATLTIARCSERGELVPVETLPTVRGARSVVAGDSRKAFVADPAAGRILDVSIQRSDPASGR